MTTENPNPTAPQSTHAKNQGFKDVRLAQEKKKEEDRIAQEEKDAKIAEDNKKKANAANSKDKDTRKKLGRDDLKTLDVGALIAQKKPKDIFDMLGFLQANLEEREDELKADPEFAAELEGKIAEIQEAVKNNGIKYDPQKDVEDVLPESPQQNRPQDLDAGEILSRAAKSQGLNPNLLDPSKFAAAKAADDNDVISSTAFRSRHNEKNGWFFHSFSSPIF